MNGNMDLSASRCAPVTVVIIVDQDSSEEASGEDSVTVEVVTPRV
jgi:hypothetical protein